eukprot:NODE_420_length_7765_cov_0.831855.p7 type:complete len:128 gc:universal NODE_420_length_7765_cov_0.831855:3518-3135(-)
MKLPSTISLSQLHLQWKSLEKKTKNQTLAHLDELQKQPWSQLNKVQKQAIYYSQFGPHGKRTPLPKNHYTKVLFGTLATIAVTGVLFLGMQSTYKYPETMNDEWKEKTVEYAAKQKANPIRAIKKSE